MNVATSMLRVQNGDSETIASAISGSTVENSTYPTIRTTANLDGGASAESLAAVGDEAAVVAQQELLAQHDRDAEDQQRRADGGGGAVSTGSPVDIGVVHVGGEHLTFACWPSSSGAVNWPSPRSSATAAP